MSTVKYENDSTKLTGVDTNSTPALRLQYLTNIYGNNKRPDNYPEFGTNILSTEYKNTAYGQGNTSNSYHNNYKRGFDSRYPSIWRHPTTITKAVRALDDWEKAALYAALGKPWTPSGGRRVTRKFRKNTEKTPIKE
jgi:hypothetical protein